MPEQRFVILKRTGNIAAMAGCDRCGHKFFTPAKFVGDSIGAEQYLFEKFQAHQCEGEVQTRRARLAPANRRPL